MTKGHDIMKNTNQMELGLVNSSRCPRVANRERRLNRANWWFNHMRDVVDRATEWQPSSRFSTDDNLLVTNVTRG
jgi:hypothetical protein